MTEVSSSLAKIPRPIVRSGRGVQVSVKRAAPELMKVVREGRRDLSSRPAGPDQQPD